MAYKLASLVFIGAAVVALTPASAEACPICFGGDPDSQITQSVNWAVFTLLGITGGVLSGFIGFILHLIKRSRVALGQEQDQNGGERFDG